MVAKAGLRKNIPPHAEVSYDVTLKEFEKVSRSVIKRINTLSEIYYVVHQKCLCKTISIWEVSAWYSRLYRLKPRLHTYLITN